MLELGPVNTQRLLAYALLHDMPEIETSDMPGPIKRKVVDRDALKTMEQDVLTTMGYELAELGADGKLIIKTADLWDATSFLAMELGFGNRHVEKIYRNQRGNFKRAMFDLGLEVEWHEIDNVQTAMCRGQGFDYPQDDGGVPLKNGDIPV